MDVVLSKKALAEEQARTELEALQTDSAQVSSTHSST